MTVEERRQVVEGTTITSKHWFVKLNQFSEFQKNLREQEHKVINSVDQELKEEEILSGTRCSVPNMMGRYGKAKLCSLAAITDQSKTWKTFKFKFKLNWGVNHRYTTLKKFGTDVQDCSAQFIYKRLLWTRLIINFKDWLQVPIQKGTDLGFHHWSGLCSNSVN